MQIRTAIAIVLFSPMTLPMTSHAETPLDKPPVAAVKPHVVESPNGSRQDVYYWLRDDTRSNPEMLAYLRAENQWYAQYAARYAKLTEKMFAEIKGRIKQDDSTVPYRSHGYYYYTRYDEGKEYAIYARRPGSLDAAEEVMLDVN